MVKINKKTQIKQQINLTHLNLAAIGSCVHGFPEIILCCHCSNSLEDFAMTLILKGIVVVLILGGYCNDNFLDNVLPTFSHWD